LERVPKVVLKQIEKFVPFGEDVLAQQTAKPMFKRIRGAYFHWGPVKPPPSLTELPGLVGEYYKTLAKGPIIGISKELGEPTTLFHEIGHHIFREHLSPIEKRKLASSCAGLFRPGRGYLAWLEEAAGTVLDNPEEVFAQATAEYFYDRGLFEKFPRTVREIVRKSVKRLVQ